MNINQQRWLAEAELLKPVLHTTREVPAEYDKTQRLGRNEALELDFKKHLVGHVTVRLGVDGVMDAPTRVRFIFGERREDLILPAEPYIGGLSRAWIQDEVVTVDYLPSTISLPRRYAFRYLKLEIVGTSVSVQLPDPESAANGFRL